MWFKEKFYSQAQIDEFVSEYERQFPGGMNEFCIMLKDLSEDHKQKHGVHLGRLISVVRSSAVFKARLGGFEIEKAPPGVSDKEFFDLSHDCTMRMRDICEGRVE